MEAFNRRDLDAVLIGAAPDVECHPPPEWVEAGFLEPCYRGRAGYRRYVSSWSDVWGDELRLEAVELIDLGDRLVLLGDMPTSAMASGVPIANKFATVSELMDGITIRVRVYFDHLEALEAVGLRE